MLLVSVDTETTGLDVKTCGIVQVAALTCGEQGIDIIMDSLCYPAGGVIPEEASLIHGIYMTDVHDAKKDEHVCSELSLTIDTIFSEKPALLVTYNGLNYDLPLLKNKGCDLNKHPHIDVYHLVQRDLSKYGLKLSEVYENYIGEPLEGAHEATSDCMATIAIVNKFCLEKDFTHQQLYNYMNTPKLVSAMPFGKHKGMSPRMVPKGYLRWMHENLDGLSPDMAYTLSLILSS